MKSITGPCVLILLSLLSVGCADYYVSPVVEMPLYREKGEIKASTGINNYGIYGSGAYSPFDHIGINATGAAGGDVNYLEGRYAYGEIGLTYYYPLSDRFSLEFTGGYGVGKFKDNSKIHIPILGALNYSGSGTFSYPYLQMALGIFPKNPFSIIGIGVRTSQLNYFYDYFTEIDNTAYNVKDNYHVIEPLLHVKFPLNDFLNINVGYSNTFFFPSTMSEKYTLYAMQMQVNIGVQVDILNMSKNRNR